MKVNEGYRRRCRKEEDDDEVGVGVVMVD